MRASRQQSVSADSPNLLICTMFRDRSDPIAERLDVGKYRTGATTSVLPSPADACCTPSVSPLPLAPLRAVPSCCPQTLVTCCQD